MPDNMSKKVSEGLNNKTKSDDTTSTIRALEKQFGRKKVLYRDFEKFVTDLSKKANLKRLEEDIKDETKSVEERKKLEQDLQQSLSNIRQQAYKAAAARYINFVEKANSDYAVAAAKEMANQEKQRREEIEQEAADRLAIFKQKYPEEAELQTEAYQRAYEQIYAGRNKKIEESLKTESDALNKAAAKEKARNDIFIKGVDTKLKQRQESARITEEQLNNEVRIYKDLVEAGADKKTLSEQAAKVKEAKQAADLAKLKADITGAVSQAVVNGAKKAFSQAETIMTDYNATINARLQGTGNTFKDIMNMAVRNTAVSPFVKTTDVLTAVKRASEQGIAYNIELRSFLATISEKIANTFDAFDSNLTRLIRIQQADTTAARLGMEASLTKFFNNMFQDTSYLSELSKTVSGAIIDANSQLDKAASAEFEYVVQKWLGSLSSLGMSSTAVSSIAEGINYLATGNVQALASNNSLQTLFAMSASRSGLSYSDMLLQGLDARTTNRLLESMVTYLKEIAEGSPNKVVRGAYGNIFNLSASDFRAIQNLTSSDISNIYSSIVDYSGMMSELNNQFSQLSSRTSISEMINNISSNAMFNLGSSIYSNPASYAMMKMLDALDTLGVDINIPSIMAMGTGVDLNTTVNKLMRSAIGLSGGMALIGTIFNALGSIGAQGGLALSSWGGTEYTTRGSGISSALGTLLGGTSSSTYVGTGSSRDIKKSALSSATDEAEETGKITNKNRRAEKTFDDFYEAVIGENAKEFVRVREAYLSQAYDDTNKWIRVYDSVIDTNMRNVFGSTYFFEHRLKVKDDTIERFAEGNTLRVVDSGLGNVTSALMEVRNATRAQASAKATTQTVVVDTESVKKAIIQAISNTESNATSLQEVINLLKQGRLEVQVSPKIGSTEFDVHINSVSPTASINIRR